MPTDTKPNLDISIFDMPLAYAVILILASRPRHTCSYRTLIDLCVTAMEVPGSSNRQRRDQFRHVIRTLGKEGAIELHRTGKQNSRARTSIAMTRRYMWVHVSRSVLSLVPARNTSDRVKKIAGGLNLNERNVWKWFATRGLNAKTAPTPRHLREVIDLVGGPSLLGLVSNDLTGNPQWVVRWTVWIGSISRVLMMSEREISRVVEFVSEAIPGPMIKIFNEDGEAT